MAVARTHKNIYIRLATGVHFLVEKGHLNET